MRVLRQGMNGSDVTAWQYFLRGEEVYHNIVDGDFGDKTNAATIKYQSSRGLLADGVVGNQTYSKAFADGFCPLTDEDATEYGPNWPPKPDFKQLSKAEKEKLFGRIEHVPAPTSGNPEGIKITNDWQKKFLTKVTIPQLKKVQYAPSNGVIFWNKNGADQMVGLWQAWEDEGLLPKVLTWSGAWAPRYIRGSRVTLSNHSTATAFDCNYSWNMLGKQPALKGQKGSVRELVEIANSFGFYWGGHWGYPNVGNVSQGRFDGMHFELAAIL